MDANVTLAKSAKPTWDGQVSYDVSVDGTVIGTVYHYTESNHHSVNNVLVRTTQRRGWRCELKVRTADLEGLDAELRQRVRFLANPRLTLDTRKRAVEELLRSRDGIARLRG